MVSYRFLLRQLLIRDLQARYRGSVLGFAWPIMQQLLQILVFTFVFHEIMQFRWPGQREAGMVEHFTHDALHYAAHVLAGLGIFNFVAEVLSRSPTCISAQPNFVTKLRFPLQLMPVVVVCTACLHLFITLAALMIVRGLSIGWSLDAFMMLGMIPLVFLPLLLFAAALGLILGSIGVFIKDVSLLMPTIITALMFLSPVFYPTASAPPAIQGVLFWNPVAFTIESTRSILLEDSNTKIPGFIADSMGLWVIQVLIGAGLLALSLKLFEKLRDGFSDSI